MGTWRKSRCLHDIFRGRIANGPASLLLTGSHGVAFAADDPLQADKQGAIVCQDWPGRGAVKPEAYYAASDLPADSSLHGMIHVFFACYGGGCPRLDNFSRGAGGAPQQIAPQAMISRLPQAMLAHPQGGALAVLAHVERAWAYSFQSGRQPQTEGFNDVFTLVLNGNRLGQATDQFNARWAALSAELADVLDALANGLDVPPGKLANLWVARDDARNYIILGDPAVRLRVDDMPVLH